MKSWICRGFAGILHESALEKIWDKVIGGSLKILAFVGVALVESTKIALQNYQTAQEAIRFIKQVYKFMIRDFEKIKSVDEIFLKNCKKRVFIPKTIINVDSRLRKR